MNTDFTVAHALAAALKRHGVELVFGQSIPSAFFLALPPVGIRQIGYRTENAGGTMADGYARISHRVGVVAAQNGPAATLLVAPLAEALKASVPVVAIVQDVATPMVDRNAFQEIDHVALFQACTKWVRRVERSDRIDDYVDMAIIAASSGRPGPAVLIVPMDLLRAPASPGSLRRQALGAYPLDRFAADPDAVARAADILVGAHRPLLIAGGGVHLSDAASEVAALSALAAVPVATTNMGKGTVDEKGPLAAGVFGNCMGQATLAGQHQDLAADADVVLFIGTRTNQNGTDTWRLFSQTARYIHIDMDGLEVGRNYEALRLVGDVRSTVRALIRAIEPLDLSLRERARPILAEKMARGRAAFRREVDAIGSGRAGALRPEYLMTQLDSLLQPDDIVVTDASYATNWALTYLTSQKPGMRFLVPRGLAGLGWGVPLGIGAKLARPAARVFAIVGDGGFGHCWQELETARRMGVSMVIILLNNGILGYQAHVENVQFGAYSDACTFAPVDHAAIARACGCAGERIVEAADFAPALRRAAAAPGTTLLEVMTDPAAYPPLNLYAGKDAAVVLRGMDIP